MSCHVGFPDLSQARRRSLMELESDVRRKGEIVSKLSEDLESEERFGGSREKRKRLIRRYVTHYERLRQDILRQFPEHRIEHGLFGAKPMSNANIRSEMRDIDNDVFRDLACDVNADSFWEFRP